MNRNGIRAFVIVSISLLMGLLIAEFLIRAYKRELTQNQNLLQQNFRRQDLLKSRYPGEYDRILGWVPQPGNHADTPWGLPTTILEDGIRSNGVNQKVLFKDVNLAVGDSFTFGDEVEDESTWPALLEGKTGQRVVNAGVFGYGIDQAYLRLLSLAPKLKPKTVLFAFIPQDLHRAGLSQFSGLQKPYFKGTEKELELANVPVPKDPIPVKLDGIRQVLGHSHVVNTLMYKFFPEFWLKGLGLVEESSHQNPALVACRIFSLLRQSQTAEVYFILLSGKTGEESEGDLKILEAVRPCLNESREQFLDVREEIIKLKTTNFEKFKRLFRLHMTPEGNEFVAETVYQKIFSRKSP